jgi:phenylacetate-CoA ligase
MSLLEATIRNVIYPLNLWFDGEWAEARYLREYERTQFLPPDAIRALQLERLQRRLRQAYDHCPYYRRKWDALGVHPSDVRRLEDLAEFPVLKKADIQTHRDEMIAENVPGDQMFVDQTGGSTGTPISYYQSYDVDLSRWAVTRRHNGWAGYRVGDKSAWVWGAPRDIPAPTVKNRLRSLLLERTLYLDTAHFTEQKVRTFNEQLKRFRPKVIFAYARALAHLARYLREHSHSVYQPRSIVTSAEVLEPADRQAIEEVFGCPVFDRYGCREVGVLASECAEHAGLHTAAEGLYFEVVVGDRLAAPGEVGKVLVTDLLNFAMPLIRYEIGDMAALETAVCPCGRGLPRLKNIAGRVTDFVVGSDGRLVSGVFLATYVIAKRPTLGQVQIRQHAPGALVYRIAQRNSHGAAPADLDFLRDATHEYVGADTHVEFEFVKELRAEPSGKFIFCRSTVDAALASK